MARDEAFLVGLLLGAFPFMLLCVAMLASLVARWWSNAKLTDTVEQSDHKPSFGMLETVNELRRDSTEVALCAARDAVKNVSSQAQFKALQGLGNAFRSEYVSEIQEAAAKAQSVLRSSGSCEVWPEFWGISLQQCQDFLAECQQDPNWNDTNSLATMVQDYVIPRTRGHGVGLAVLLNKEEPREVSIMVSHAWLENAKDFVETLARTVSKTDIMFICAFSLYQCEDGAGPSIKEQLGSEARESPFRRVLFHIRTKGKVWGILWQWNGLLKMFPTACFLYGFCFFSVQMMIHACVPTFDGCAALKSAEWEYVSVEGAEYHSCVIGALVSVLVAIAVHLALKILRIYNGRIVAVPNHECDLYTRLWCVYEIYVAFKMHIPIEKAKTLASCGSCRSREATCTNSEDQNRIRTEIESRVPVGSGYDCIDKAVHKLNQSERRGALWILGTNGPILSICGTAAARCLLADAVDAMCMLGIVCGIWFAGATTCGILCTMSKLSSGLPTWRKVIHSIAWPSGLAMLSAVFFIPLWEFQRSSVHSFVFGVLGALAVSFAQSSVSLALLAAFATSCSTCVRTTKWHMEVILVPSLVIFTLFIVLLTSVGSEGLLFPKMVLYAFISAWALGRLQSIWTLSVAWGIAIAEHRLTLKGQQRSLPKPNETALALDPEKQIEEDTWSV